MYGFVKGNTDSFHLEDLVEYAIKDRNALNDSFTGVYEEYGVVQPPYNPSLLASLPEANSTHMACIDVIAGDVAGRGYDITGDEDGVAAGFFEALQDPLSTVLYNAVSDYQALGYGAVSVVYGDDGVPVDLYHVPAHTLRRHGDGLRVVQMVGGRSVWFKLQGVDGEVDKDTGEFHESLPAERRAETLLWFNNYNPRSHYYGLAPIIPAIPSIYMALAARRFNASFFKNYGVPSLLMVIKGSFIDQSAVGGESMQQQASEALKSVMNNPHSAMILTLKSPDGKAVDLDIKELGAKSNEGEFIELLRQIDDEIMSVHRVPPYRISINRMGSLGGNTALESGKIYYESVISPIQERIASMITKHVIKEGLGVDDATIRLKSASMREFKEDIDSVTALVQAGVLSPAEAREYVSPYFNLKEEVAGPEAEALYSKGVPLDAAAAMSLQPVAEVAKSIERARRDLEG